MAHKLVKQTVQLRNGDTAYVDRVGHTSSNILIGTYNNTPICWFSDGFWHFSGADGVDKDGNSTHRPLDIMNTVAP